MANIQRYDKKNFMKQLTLCSERIDPFHLILNELFLTAGFSIRL